MIIDCASSIHAVTLIHYPHTIIMSSWTFVLYTFHVDSMCLYDCTIVTDPRFICSSCREIIIYIGQNHYVELF